MSKERIKSDKRGMLCGNRMGCHRRNLVKAAGFLVLGLLSGLCAGCGKGEPSVPARAQEEPEEVIPPGTYVPTASFREAIYQGFMDPVPEDYSWQGDTVLYIETEWPDGSQDRQRRICRRSLDGLGEPETVIQENLQERTIEFFFGDEEGNLYLVGRAKPDTSETSDKAEDQSEDQAEAAGNASVWDSQDSRLYYGKFTGDGQQIFLVYPEGVELEGENLVWAKGYADSSGNGYILDKIAGNVFFFDREGNYLGSVPASLAGGKLLDAGEMGVYLWEENWEQRSPDIQKLDVQKAAVGEVETLGLSGLLETMNYTMLSGYEEGMLLSTSSTLYRYDPETGELEELLKWSDGRVNIDGSQAVGLRGLHRDERGNLEFEVLLASWTSNQAEIAAISYADASTLPRRKTVTLGGSRYTGISLDKVIKRFNRENGEYQIELVEYDEETLMNDLIYGKEQVPDLLDAGAVSVSLLEHKGLLEDMEPYFADSQVVRREDILEGVWEAGYADGHLVRAITAFQIQALVATADTIPGPGYTPEELLALQQANPDSRLLDYCYPYQVLSLALTPQLERYVDWEKGKASFDSDDFVQLLETVGSFNYPEDPSLGRNQRIFHEDEEIRKFLKGEYLIRQEYFGSYYDYQKKRDTYKDKATFIGYPSEEGEPYFMLVPQKEFCIYGGSSRKAGAWAFIEYLLSETSQSWYGSEQGSFPVRKESFAAYLERPYSETLSFVGEVQKEEYRQELMDISGYLCQNGMDDRQIQTILLEETEAYFAGDKTARETADVIQNRVQLYLDEQ